MNGKRTHGMMKRIGALLAAVLLAWPAATQAQVTNLDKATLIDTLAREGMSELLLHLLEVEPPDDPVVTALIRIGQLRIRYMEATDQATQIERFDELRSSFHNLINEHNEHEQRPIWQTDLAELLLFSYLQGTLLNAAEFYDFAVPLAEQRRGFEDVVPEALEELADAAQRFRELQSILPRDEVAHQRRIASGLWDRMLDDYAETRTRYFLAHAAYLATLLPDTNRLFANLGTERNMKIPGQARTPGEERSRLLELTIDRLERFIEDQADPYDIRSMSLVLEARAMIALGSERIAPALEKLETVLATNRTDLPNLVAHFAKARALSRQNQPLAALSVLAGLRTHPLIQAGPLQRILLADVQHRTLMADAQGKQGQARTQAITEAYEPYLELLDDPQLGEVRDDMRVTIYRRWQDTLPSGADLADQPAVVVMALGEIARLEGQEAFSQGYDLQQQGREEQAREHFEQASPRFARAREVLRNLIQRPNLPASVEAKALYNLGWAVYFEDPTALRPNLEASRIWTDMADRMSDQPEAEEAIGNAEQLLRRWYIEGHRPPGVREAYERAARVMFDKFPLAEPAASARLFYGYYVLVPADRFAEAAEMFSQVPYGHPNYFEARREMLIALQRVFEDTQDADQREVIEDQIRQAADQLFADIARARPEALPTDLNVMLEAEGRALLVLFDLHVARGEIEDGMKLLEGFDGRFAEIPAVVQSSLEKRIIALTQLPGRGEEIEQIADRMMRQFPTESPGVIDAVLETLDRQIERLRAQADEELVELRRTELLTQAQNKAGTASMLAGLLVQWAERQGYTEQQMLPFRLIETKALRLAGNAERALQVIEPLYERFGNDGMVIHHYGESLFAVGAARGDHDVLVRAAGQFDTLITGIQEQPYPAIWWNAWMRRLQISDLMNQGVHAIPLRVDALTRTDPNLGGEPYRSTLQRLAGKHRR